MRYKEEKQLNTWGELLSFPFLSLNFTPVTSLPLPFLSSLPTDYTPSLEWGGGDAGGWDYCMEVSFCCSFFLISSAPMWAPQRCPCAGMDTSTAAVPSGVSLLWCREPLFRNAPPAMSSAMSPSPWPTPVSSLVHCHASPATGSSCLS